MIWRKKPRLETDYTDFRKTVLNRDGHMCQMPYCESKRNLVVHHIKPYAKSPTLRTDPENGIALCRKCHKRIFGKESEYSHIFLSIIKTNGMNNENRSGKNRNRI